MNQSASIFGLASSSQIHESDFVSMDYYTGKWSNSQLSHFHVNRSNLLKVHARTNTDLPSLVILAILIEINQMLHHEANRKWCPHGSLTALHGMTRFLVEM